MGRNKADIKLFNTQNLPQPGGHYSQAVIHEGLIYLSGQLPFNPFTGEKIVGSVEDQCKQILDNIDVLLRDAGSAKDRVIKCNIYISDISYWPAVNEVYASYFGRHKPARSIVPVKDLHFGFKIEIDLIASV